MNFTQFKARRGEAGIQQLAINYAATNFVNTIEEIAKNEDITETCLRTCIAYAITHCLISYSVCLDIKSKSRGNQSRHISKGEKSTPTSEEYYDRLIEERIPFVKKIRGERAENVVQYYINNPNFSTEFIANALGFSKKELSIILRNSIIFGVANDQEVEELVSIAIRKAKSNERDHVKKVFESYEMLREGYANQLFYIDFLTYELEHYDEYMAEIELLEHQLTCFDRFNIPDEGISKEDIEKQLEYLRGKPSKEELEAKLSQEKKALESFENRF